MIEKIQIYCNNIHINFNNDSYAVRSMNKHNFRNCLCTWMWCMIFTLVLWLECLDFSCALTTSGKGAADEIPSSSAHTMANPRACILRLHERGGDERSIPSIGGTREKLIEKHFDDTTSAKNKRGEWQPGPVLPFIERTRSWSSKPRRKERTRATWRKKALTTKANMVVNERVASTFSVP